MKIFIYIVMFLVAIAEFLLSASYFWQHSVVLGTLWLVAGVCNIVYGTLRIVWEDVK